MPTETYTANCSDLRRCVAEQWPRMVKQSFNATIVSPDSGEGGFGFRMHQRHMAGRKDPTESLPERDESTFEPQRVALVIAPESAQAKRVTIGNTPVKIGSDPDQCDVVVDDPHVSRVHATIAVTPQGVLVEDQDSSNGTVVNGIPIKIVVLESNATLTLGTTDLALIIRGRVETQLEEIGPSSFGGAVGSSYKMRSVFALLRKLAPTDLTISLLGETGCGKDVLARAVHENSRRANGPFVVFDCGAVQPNLIESELFGHRKGAFTGAMMDRAGAFERAHTGTLFLDEVGELPLDLQPRLLRALEERRVRHVGGNDPIPVDVRVIAATNRNLEHEVEQGRFRQDLFFRLNAAVVRIPPLRERLEDLEELANTILASEGKDLVLAPRTLAALKAYDWPGNVRELKNVMTSASALTDHGTLEPKHLMFFKTNTEPRATTLDGLPLGGRMLMVIEKEAIKQTLDQLDGNKTRAAKTLGIAPSTLYEKIKKYGL